MSPARKIDLALRKAEKAGIVLLVSLMVGLSFLQVLLRLFWAAGFFWADIFLRHLVLWVGFLGAALATSDGGHFAIDSLKKKLPPRFRRPLSIFLDFLAGCILLLLTGASWKYYKDEVQAKSILFSLGTLPVPSYFMTAIIPAGICLMAVHFFLRFLSPPEKEESHLP